MATNNAELDEVLTAVAHVVGRAGLAMSGAMCGTFVAAEFGSVNAAWFDSAPFVAAMVLSGFIGFYLGIDIPRLHAVPAGQGRIRFKADPVLLLSATGTFLAAIAALISIYSFIFDEPLHGTFEYVVGSWWVFGITMQIAAGVTGRIYVTAPVAG